MNCTHQSSAHCTVWKPHIKPSFWAHWPHTYQYRLHHEADLNFDRKNFARRIYLRDTTSLLASKKGRQPARKGDMQRGDEKENQAQPRERTNSFWDVISILKWRLTRSKTFQRKEGECPWSWNKYIFSLQI